MRYAMSGDMPRDDEYAGAFSLIHAARIAARERGHARVMPRALPAQRRDMPPRERLCRACVITRAYTRQHCACYAHV